ncbi:ATP-dependent RNA helicase DOB1 [Nematocida displodere]|uniref:ATP-dependent RNA helicase DOB1 n=1 Tax=Nematocida displodere TaxID=1805483 RepID=A0A177EC85_9MICR|nr:ATP-dependent RNA helicase DOB1 [Nematocida displodere]
MKSSLLSEQLSVPSLDDIERAVNASEDNAEEVDSFVESNDNKNLVRHTCIIPPAFAYAPLSETKTPVRCTYPFQLDRFQELALKCLERDESVLVSAHTSAGKTLIAEYAIHLSILKKQRVIYTSPIKALSNQKYRELNEKFGDVGLMTGDVTLNPDSTCLVMTTEILRNMIYRGTEVLRETHFVVFDEVHYMRDRERGVVWEETIILLPSTTRFIFLSATIPNAEEFARWIVSIHKQPCHVIYTEKRPTPLEHYIYSNLPESPSYLRPNSTSLVDISDRVSLVVDKDGEFQSKGFKKLQSSLAGAQVQKRQRQRQREKINVVDILRILQSTNNIPTIVFSFRRKECEDYGLTALREFDFNTEEEKELVDTIFTNALNSLRDEDRSLPQITSIIDMLKRGIGIHHSGLLPIIKEIIEILFQENLLKVLFATETFSIGLNMPAKSVVFTSIKKFDGLGTRFVTSGEYIQMSGRAGRRGRDTIGNVILALESSAKIEEKEIRNVLHGPSNSLDSAFRLSYNTILNLLRLDGMDEEYIIKHSFLQFRQELKGRKLVDSIKGLLALYSTTSKKIAEIDQTRANLIKISKLFALKMQIVQAPLLLHPDGIPGAFLTPGRIVVIQAPALLADTTTPAAIEYPDVSGPVNYQQVVVTEVREKSPTPKNLKAIFEDGTEKEIPTSCIIKVSKSKIESGSKTMHKHTQEYFRTVKKRKLLPAPEPEPLSFYTPKDLGSSNAVGDNLIRIEERISETETNEEEKTLLNLLSLQAATSAQITMLNDHKKKTELIMIEEYKSKKKILHALSYITDNEVLMKGKVASEISSGDELLLTEMLFNNELSALSPGRICSLLSCIVFDEKTDRLSLTPESETAYKILQTTAQRLSSEFKRLDSTFTESEYLEKFSPNLMDVVYTWTEGHSFGDICKTTDVFEGSIIRCFRRLEEVLKEMSRASKVIGNVEMENKFSAAISLVKRDIVFANSLYL